MTSIDVFGIDPRTHVHSAHEVTYCLDTEPATNVYGWWCYDVTEKGRVATTPVFEQWHKLLHYMNQQGYTYSRDVSGLFVRRDEYPEGMHF